MPAGRRRLDLCLELCNGVPRCPASSVVDNAAILGESVGLAHGGCGRLQVRPPAPITQL